MGKRLPKSRKHKKLKFVDPCYKGPLPTSRKRKLQPNEPPKEERDEQEMSRYLKEVIDSKQKMGQNKFKRRKKKKKIQSDDFIVVKNNIIDHDEPGMEKKMKKVPAVVKQKQFENETQFFRRIQNMVDMAVAEAKVEDKYNIEVLNVDKKGNAEYVAPPKETSEKKKEKRRKLKKLKTDDTEFELKKERIEFGEVVNAPPVLSVLKKAPEFSKAGKRELVLKSMLPSNSQSVEEKVTPLSKKWKSIHPEKRKVMESERLRAVQMYRLLKSKKS